MKILVTGGNGNISWWFVKLAVEYGHQVYVIGRSFEKPTRREIPKDVVQIHCDYRNIEETQQVLSGLAFDVVCDFICYNKEHAQNAIKLFKATTQHYIFISSESIYQKKTEFLPFKETTPVSDPKTSGKYIGGKIEAEAVFKKAFEEFSFPVTIIRPSYTYDTLIPTSIGLNCYTAINRYLLDNVVLIAGDGINLWTFTHAKDFGRALIGVIGNPEAVGEDYNVTSDEWLTWNDLTAIIIETIQLPNPKVIHIPREKVLGFELLGDTNLLTHKLSHSIYDNSKIKKMRPDWKAEIGFREGITKTLQWLQENSVRQRINPSLDALIINLTKSFV
jgi:nucleoside-diphosphate-sugar epimerase